MIFRIYSRFLDNQFFRFCFIGGISTIIHVFILVTQMELLGVKYASVSNVFAACVSLIFAYFGNRNFVFRSAIHARKAPFVKFVFTYICILFIHFLTPLLLTDFWNKPYPLSFALALLIHIPFSFLMNKYWVFK